MRGQGLHMGSRSPELVRGLHAVLVPSPQLERGLGLPRPSLALELVRGLDEALSLTLSLSPARTGTRMLARWNCRAASTGRCP